MSTSIVVAEKGLPRRTQRTEEGTGPYSTLAATALFRRLDAVARLKERQLRYVREPEERDIRAGPVSVFSCQLLG